MSTPHHRNRLLAQMGISQFELRRPFVFKGELAHTLPPATKLIVITQNIEELDTLLFSNILQALSLSLNEIYCIVPEQKIMLCEDPLTPIWYIADAETLLWQKRDNAPYFHTPSLTELQNNPSQKRTLWQTICHYDHYFFAHNG